MNSEKIKIGAKIIEDGKVYRIFKIEKRQFQGETENFIFYKPYFNYNDGDTVICSIPSSSINKTSIRPPASIDDIKDLIKSLGIRTEKTDEFDSNDAKDMLKENRLKRTALVAKKYWLKKHSEIDKLSFSQRRIMQNAIESLTEEIALVNNLSLEKAETLITSKLAK